MELQDIKELIGTINESDLAYFELKFDNNYIKMDKSLSRNTSVATVSEKVEANNKFEAPVVQNTINELPKTESNPSLEGKESEEGFDVITSPMVGTFYGSSSPEADAFVSKGDSVSKGKTLCIVEAMKLMNEIEAEYDCEIVDILVKDGEMVEYGKPLFKVRRG